MTNIRRKKLNEYIENYDNMFNTYKIRTICETEHIQSYYFYNGTGQFRRTESVLLIFHPEGITITGDLCPNGDGICSNRISSTFYKQNFTTDQLARKFNLKHDEFDQEIAEQDLKDYISELIEKIKDEFGTKYSLRNDEKLSTAKDILKAIYSYSPQELYNDMSEIEHDYWDNPFGFYYNIRDLGLLVSLQKNFMREYSILIETREF